LHPLLSSRLQASIGPQQLFDGVKLLLERGRAELVQNEGRACLALCAGDRTRPENLSQGDLVELAAAIAAANGYGRPNRSRICMARPRFRIGRDRRPGCSRGSA